MYSVRVYVLVAALMALSAYLIGELVSGAGVPFVALTSTQWTAHAVSRGRRAKERCF